MLLFLACVLLLVWITVSKKKNQRTTIHEHLSLKDYSCLISNIEKKINGKIVQLVMLTTGMMYVVVLSGSVGKTYKVAYDESTLQPTSVYVMGNEPMSEEHLYLKERSTILPQRR
jgi:ABC-type Fe3+ transport system permease subunit